MQNNPPTPVLRFGVLFALTIGLLFTSQASHAWQFHSWLSASPSAVAFNGVKIGSSGNQSLTLTNSGFHTITVTSATVSEAGFNVTGPQLPASLEPGGNLTFSVAFAPTEASNIDTSIVITWAGRRQHTLTVPVSATAASAATLSVSPSSLDFGKTLVGESQTRTVTLTAGALPVTISSATTTDPEFVITAPGLPVTIAAGASVPVSVQFAPKSSGTASSTLSFVDGAGSAVTESLSGAGLVATAHNVSLQWQGNSSDTVGYHVYRSTSPGGPYTRLTSLATTAESYSDNAVENGATYYYVVTAVDSENSESEYSGEASASVPSQ